MNLRKLILTQNACYKAGRTIIPKGIMIHSTGANNPNLKRYVGPNDGLLGENQYNNHWNQDKPEGRHVCPHVFIGKLADGSIATYQTLPWDHRGWHAGGDANNTHIGIEICEDNLKDGIYFNQIYNEAISLCVFLCKKYNISPDNVIGHYEGYKKGIASNHADLNNWFPKHDKDMINFRKDVQNTLYSPLPSPTPPSSIKLYRVQVGAYSKKENAYAMLKKLKQQVLLMPSLKLNN